MNARTSLSKHFLSGIDGRLPDMVEVPRCKDLTVAAIAGGGGFQPVYSAMSPR
jgi:hypothetical protein